MVKEFLPLLGKPKDIAEQLQALSGRRCTVGAVYQWPYDGRIAEKWCPWIAKLAKKKRLPKDQVPDEVRSFMQ